MGLGANKDDQVWCRELKIKISSCESQASDAILGVTALTPVT